MTWIATVPYEQSTGRLRQLYDRVKGPGTHVDNIMMAHSLRPHTMEAHMMIYKYVLYHSGNEVPSWMLETIGAYVSVLNGCGYCTAHHFEGLRRLIKDEDRSNTIFGALAADKPEFAFVGRELAMLRYARELTLAPRGLTEVSIQALRDAGLNDGEILEVNQVTAYFAYANRMVNGLGVDTRAEIVGLSPNDPDDGDNWSHSKA
ncbi:MAG: alkylhydroperoxidase [Alphaproteobacteria bacterium]|nr:alkylhydroperoxidase [Alphaproteobacteria bacterium]